MSWQVDGLSIVRCMYLVTYGKRNNYFTIIYAQPLKGVISK